MVANALGERNARGNWTLPTPPAFGSDEVETIRRWVQAGGSLFLIADHMPFPGAAETLASAFGILLPVTAWRFSDSTPRISGRGMLQGAAVKYGRGRVAMFGEAAMFSAQVSGPQRRPMGMNDPTAGQVVT